MIEIRNSDNKLVCAINPYEKKVEIVSRGAKTTIVFLPTGDIKITNTKEEKQIMTTNPPER